MAQPNFAQEYKKNAVNGASPLQLVIMLYDAALRHMHAGKAAMARGDLQAQNKSLQQAQRIVMELMSALDLKQGKEIADNLLSLYSYVLEQLVQANIEDRPEGIDRAAKTLEELREGWRELEANLRYQEPLAA